MSLAMLCPVGRNRQECRNEGSRSLPKESGVGFGQWPEQTQPNKIMTIKTYCGGLFGDLPVDLRRRLGLPPKSGGGVHCWIFKAACILKEHYQHPLVFRIIREAVSECGRPVPDCEISNAIAASEQPASQSQAGPAAIQSKPRWPETDLAMVRKVVEDHPDAKDFFGDGALNGLKVLQGLFPGNPLVCMGDDIRRMETKPLHAWQDSWRNMQFVVPSPMNALTGVNQQGKESNRCLDNTGKRRFAVVEFDKHPEYVQAAIHAHLDTKLPLAAVVHSGGKSLHGWYYAENRTESELRLFMEHAVSLGADPATWTRCQAVRLPGGIRSNGVAQAIRFFNPGYGGLFS